MAAEELAQHRVGQFGIVDSTSAPRERGHSADFKVWSDTNTLTLSPAPSPNLRGAGGQGLRSSGKLREGKGTGEAEPGKSPGMPLGSLPLRPVAWQVCH